MPLGLASTGMRRDFPLSGTGVDAPRLVVFEVINLEALERGSPMEQITRGQAVRVGVDSSQARDPGSRRRCRRPGARHALWPATSSSPGARNCLRAVPWPWRPARAHTTGLVALGLEARIIAAQLVSPYRKQGASGKNDANDAAAICEAASRPQMHFVPVKSIEQQSMLCVHRLREG